MNKDRSEWSQFRRVLQVMKASPPWLGCPTAIRIGGVVGGGRAKGGSGLEGKAMTLTFGPAMKDKLGDPQAMIMSMSAKKNVYCLLN